MNYADLFDALMMVCFGCSWPIAIAKTLRVRKVHGKSIGFLFMVHIGYLSGITAKVIRAGGSLPSWVTILYAVNAAMVMIEIILYFRFRRPQDEPALNIQPESPGAELTENAAAPRRTPPAAAP